MSFINITLSQWIILFGICVYLFYRLITRNYGYFKKRGIKFDKPYPFFGSIGPIVFGKISFQDMFLEIYNKFPTESVVGVFEFHKPVYFIRDPELIKQIMVKYFDHFINHRHQIDDDIEPMITRGLIFMKDEKWKNMRATLSPAFTGSKMRQMFSLMVECSKDTASHMKSTISSVPIEMEMKDFFTRFTTDIIASCAFGVKVDSLRERNNEFFLMGKLLTNFEGIKRLKFFLLTSFSKVMKFFNIGLFDKRVVDFFRNLVQSAMKNRVENNIVRPDMINLLIQAKQGSLKHEESDKKFEQNDGYATVEESEVGKSNKTFINWTDDDFTSQCLFFFLAGFDTVATVMSFMSYELAANPDVQQKLLEEIDAVKAELNGKPVTYEIIQKMKYMDMTVSETLRRWPAIVLLDRYCNAATTIKNNDGQIIIDLKSGDGVWFPVYSYHNDPNNFPNPNKFDPERFSDENKQFIKPFTYMPFGMGPRNCIGSRFALIEVKALFFEILSEISFEKSPKTQYPVKLAQKKFTLEPENGFWVQYRKRDKKFY